MDTLSGDVRFAVRTLRKSPGFSIVAILILALGIGANTAIFSVADALIRRPLRGVAADRLVAVATGQKAPAAPADFTDWQRVNHSFAELAAYRSRDVNVTGGGPAERAYAAAVTGNFFTTLRVDARIGRTIGIADQNGAAVAVLSYGFWQRRFGGASGILGATIDVDGLAHTIIGVMDADFEVPVPTDIWIPLSMTSAERDRRDALLLHVIGRLKIDATLQSAQADMSTIALQLERGFPDTNLNRRVHVIPLTEFVQGTITRSAIGILVLVVGAVLLVACINLAGLQLARATARARELAVRSALGASRLRIVQLVVVENLAVSAIGGIAGVAVASVLVHALLASMSSDVARLIPGFVHIQVDSHALAFAAAATVGSALLASMVPALRSADASPAALLNEIRGIGASGPRQRLQNTFVVVQIAVAFTLLMVSWMGTAGFQSLLNARSESDPDRIVVMSVSLPRGRYDDAASWRRFSLQGVSRLEEVIGVEDAATFSTIPFSNNGTTWAAIDIEGTESSQTRAGRPAAVVQRVSLGYFRLMRIALGQGRLFDSADDAVHPPVAIVSRTMATRYWPTESALGKRIKVGRDAAPAWVTVVGVVGDVLYDWTDRVPEPTVYLPVAQAPSAAALFAVRTAGDPGALIRQARGLFAQLDPLVPVSDVMSLRDAIDESLSGNAQIVVLIDLLALLTILIAAIGLYGVISYAVAARLKELGLRLALGASRVDILWLVLRRGMWVAGVGLACGAALAIPVTQSVRGIVFGTTRAPTTLALETVIVLAIVMLAACYVPARRALTADPMTTLRIE